MKNLILSKLSNHPEAAIGSGIISFVSSLIEWATPMIQFLVLLGSLVIIILTIIGKAKKMKKK